MGWVDLGAFPWEIQRVVLSSLDASCQVVDNFDLSPWSKSARHFHHEVFLYGVALFFPGGHRKNAQSPHMQHQ